MKKLACIFLLLLSIAAIFALHPAVEYHRNIVPENIYLDKDCDCSCILKSRPWYSRFNYWFWMWATIVPLFLITMSPKNSKWYRALMSLSLIGLCYIFMNLSIHLFWDIRNGPFTVHSNYPWQKSWDNPGPKCANIASGASQAFTLILGWIYAIIYVGWWKIIWVLYHKHITKTLDKTFQYDYLNKLIVIIASFIASVILLIAILIPFALGGSYILKHFKLIEAYKSFFF